MTDQRSANDALDPSDDDEITIDPELTTAADAAWLADLRSQAKSSGVSVGELLNAPDTVDGHDAVTDDDHDAVTVAHAAASRAPSTAAATGADAADDADDAATIAPDDDTMDAVRAAVAAARRPPEVEQPTPPTAPVPVELPIVAVAPAPTDPGERWEPPARLTTGREAPIPMLDVTETRRSNVPLIAGLGVVVLALIVLIAVLLWPSNGDTPIDPSDSVVEIEVDREAPVGVDSE